LVYKFKERCAVKIKKIHHVAVVVPELEGATTLWRDVFGLDLEHQEDVPSQKSRVASFAIGESKLELVQPTSDDSGVAKFLSERGGGMHHICLEVDDIESSLAELKEKGIRLINDTPQVLEGRKMAFIHPKATGGVLVELYQLI
jgi:methylmalonyl-CoA/ethylmalonyl-CoA epimerase